MKFKKLTLCISLLIGWSLPGVTEASTSVIQHAQGRIVLQVEDNGEAWYVHPVNFHRYYLGRPDDAFEVMRFLGVGITNANLERIPTVDQSWIGDAAIMPHVNGKIVLQVEAHGEAWYVHPADGKRYYLGRPEDAWNLMTELGLGITNANLDLITIGSPNETIMQQSVLLNVPFTAQAPYGNWVTPFDEACEESILVMLAHYLAGTSLSADEANAEILNIVNWETQLYGYHEDTSTEVTARTAREYFDMTATVSYDVTADAIKQHLSDGDAVIVPVYGKVLGNVHYQNGGPYYHMILLIGYDGDTFISHDPGTRYGAQYRYSSDVLLNAIHDLTEPESNGASGQPAMIIIDT